MTDTHQREEAGASEAYLAIQRLSHELRTPLTVVIGFCDLLAAERQDDASTKEFATRIATNAWRLHAAVEHLLAELERADIPEPSDDVPLGWSSGPNAVDPAARAVTPDHNASSAELSRSTPAPADDAQPGPFRLVVRTIPV